jgi:hypothetical protein
MQRVEEIKTEVKIIGDLLERPTTIPIKSVFLFLNYLDILEKELERLKT